MSLLLIPLQANAIQNMQSNPHLNILNKRLNYKEMRNRGVVMQGYDLSCGSAALATLFRYYYGDKTGEKEILDYIMQERKASLLKNIEKPKGLSLYDLKVVAEHFNYRSSGFRISFEELYNLSGPVIVHLEDDSGGHFAVLKGIKKVKKANRVYLADPSNGNTKMSVHRFKERWNGIIFVVEHNEKPILANSPLVMH